MLLCVVLLVARSEAIASVSIKTVKIKCYILQIGGRLKSVSNPAEVGTH